MCDRVYLWVVCHEWTREREKGQRKGNINLNVSSVFKHARVSRRDNYKHFAIHNFFLIFNVDDSSSCITTNTCFLSISIIFITLEGGFGHNTIIKWVPLSKLALHYIIEVNIAVWAALILMSKKYILIKKKTVICIINEIDVTFIW